MEWRPFGDDGSALLFSGGTDVGVVSKRDDSERWTWRLSDVAPSRYGPATCGERATPAAARAALSSAWRRWLAERGLDRAGAAADARHATLVEALRALVAEVLADATEEAGASVAAHREGHVRRARYLDGKAVGRRSVANRIRELTGDKPVPAGRRAAARSKRSPGLPGVPVASPPR